MMSKPESRFVYVTYIKTTPEKLWHALTNDEFSRQFWLGNHIKADWKQGGDWKIVRPDGSFADTGQIVEFKPMSRLAIRWQHEMTPELKAEGWSLCTMEIEPADEVLKLTITHSIEREQSKLIGAVSGGWPRILSNLKSVLETGAPIMTRKN